MGFNNKKYKYTTWKEYVYQKKRLFLLIIIVIISLLTLTAIPFIELPSTTRNEVSLFVNYADNDVGIDIIPEGLKYNWYLNGVIIEYGTVDATGILTFSIMEFEGVYILELGKKQYNNFDYTPNIANYTYIHGVFSDEITIGAKLLEGNMFWEGAIPLDTQRVDLYFNNGIEWVFVKAYMTDSEGFVDANVIKGSYRWQIGTQLAITPPTVGIQWHDYPKHVDFTFAPKVVRGIIIIVLLAVLEKGGFRVAIFIFLLISSK
ncbi:hypothetical protein ES705_25337 [subsurface metagenome]